MVQTRYCESFHDGMCGIFHQKLHRFHQLYFGTWGVSLFQCFFLCQCKPMEPENKKHPHAGLKHEKSLFLAWVME